jgi:NAD(P)H-nitrite reductase large subunit
MNYIPKKRKFLLIGAGVASIAAAQSIREVDAQAEILIVSDDPAGYYSRPGLAYYLTGEINRENLFPFTEKDFRELGITRLNKRILRILPETHQVIDQDQQVISYDRLLIATGSTAIPFMSDSLQVKGVVKLDHLADADAILRTARRRQTAVVVGGGITALELAEGLRDRGMHVHLIMRGSQYWGNVLDPLESEIIERRLEQRGISLHKQAKISQLITDKDQLSAVRFQDGSTLACRLLAAAIGVRPQLSLAQQAGILTDRGILVDEQMQTNLADIYAAGDCAQVFDPSSGMSVLDSLWTTARQQGTAAGANMAGIETPYRRSTPYNVTRLADIPTTIIGRVGGGVDEDLQSIARGDSETWRQDPFAAVAQTTHEINRVRIMVGPHTLRGSVIMGEQSLSRVVYDFIDQQIDITDIRENLLKPGASLVSLLTNRWASWQRANDRPAQ